MKKPIFNLEERFDMKHNTYLGAKLMFRLALLKLRREIYKSSVLGWLHMKYFDYASNGIRL